MTPIEETYQSTTNRGMWVIGFWEGDAAKVVKAHADAGLGYFVRQSGGRGGNVAVEAAFRQPHGAKLGENMKMATIDECQRLNALYDARYAVRPTVEARKEQQAANRRKMEINRLFSNQGAYDPSNPDP